MANIKIYSESEIRQLYYEKYSSISHEFAERILSKFNYEFWRSNTRSTTRNNEITIFSFCDWSYTSEGAFFWSYLHQHETRNTLTKENLIITYVNYEVEFQETINSHDIWYQ